MSLRTAGRPATVALVLLVSFASMRAEETLPVLPEGVRWPRFPFDPVSRSEPLLAILYTPDDIGQSIDLSKIGAPDRMLFRLHKDHPRLKIALMSCPANRYVSEKPLEEFPAGQAV